MEAKHDHRWVTVRSLGRGRYEQKCVGCPKKRTVLMTGLTRPPADKMMKPGNTMVK